MTGRALIASVTGLAWLAMSTGAGAELFVCPEQGIGQAQMRQDQFARHHWAKAQTGFDPSHEYGPRFRKVLPDRALARFFQVERKLDALVNAELAERVPLVE